MYRKTRLRKIAVVFQFSFVFVIILLSSFQDNGQMMPFQNQSIEETEEPKFDFTKRIDVASDVSGVVFIDGTNPSQDWDDSPYVTGSGTFNDPFIIEDLVFTDCGGKSGIVIQNTTSYFKIENCSISRTGTESEWGGHSSDWEYIGNRAGIQLLNVGNGTIVGNVFDDVANGFLLRNCKNITLEDNHVETSANQGIAAVDCSNITLTSNTARSWSCGAMVINCDNSSYIDNQLLSFAHDGLHMIDSDFNLFFANNISYCHWFGIDATNSKNNLFIRNLLTNNGYPGYSGRGIHGENIENSTIIGNDCTMNTDAGIYIYDSDNCIIEGNNCSATKDPEELVGNYGIYTSGSFYLSLINNTCYAPSGTGMRLDSAYHSIVRNNTCSFNANHGIYYWFFVVNTTMEFNNCSYNGKDGIHGPNHLRSSKILSNLCQHNNQSGISIVGETDGVVSTIEQNDCSYNLLHGIHIQNVVDSIKVVNNTIRNNWGWGIYLTKETTNNIVANNTVQSNEFGCIEDLGIWNYVYNNTCIQKYAGYASRVIIRGGYPYLGWDDCEYVSGSGTLGDPYRIEDLVIYVGGPGPGIRIENTTRYFVVENCTVVKPGLDSYELDAAIVMNGVANGTLQNNTCTGAIASGIVLETSKNNTLRWNNCSDNAQWGIWLGYETGGNLVYGNYLERVGYGCVEDLGTSNNIFNNTCTGLSGYTQRVLIDGAFEYRNWDDFDFITGEGTIGDPYIIEDLVIYVGGPGVGIEIRNTNKYFQIENCTIIKPNPDTYENDAAIKLLNAANGTILDCLIYNTSANGILLIDSSYNTIVNNNITSNTLNGILLLNSNNTLISSNNCSENGQWGLTFSVNTIHNEVTSNRFMNNLIGCVEDVGYNYIHDNICPLPDGSSAKIRIDGLSPYHEWSDCPYITGMGTVESPYLLENLTIIVNTPGSGILIENTREHFIIHNCTVTKASVNLYYVDSLIMLRNSTNGVLNENKVNAAPSKTGTWPSMRQNIHLDTSTHLLIVANNCTGGTRGIYVNSSDSVRINQNTCTTTDYGLDVETTTNSTLSHNYCTENTFNIRLTSTKNSTIENCYSLLGDIQINHSNDTRVIGCNILNASHGIWVEFSDYCNITGNTMTYCVYGGYFSHMEYSDFGFNNIFENIGRGIFLRDGNYNSFILNNLSGNVLLRDSNHVVFQENSFSYGRIELLRSDYNSITLNNCTSSASSGISLSASEYNNVTENTCSYNQEYGIYLDSSCTNNNISTNFLIENKLGCILDEGTDNTLSGNYCRPPPPTITTPSQLVKTSTFLIQWTEISYADSYNLYIDGVFDQSVGTNEATISIPDEGNYTIYVTSVASGGESLPSNSIVLEYVIPPSPPTILTSNQTIYTASILVEWTSVPDATHYNIYIDGDFYNTTTSTQSTIHFTRGGTRLITVRSVEVDIESFDSNTLEVVVTAVDAPTILTPSQTIDNLSINIQWTNVEYAEYYNVYIDGVLNTTVTGNETTLTFPGVGEYALTVHAVNGSLESEASNIVTITVELQPPAAPVFTAPPYNTWTCHNESVTFQWTAVEGAESYNIYIDGVFHSTVYLNEAALTFEGYGFGVKYVTVTAVRFGLESAHSVSVRIIVRPPAPTLITKSQVISETSILLQWNEVVGVDLYNVYVNGIDGYYGNTTELELLVTLLGDGTYEITVSSYMDGGIETEWGYASSIIITVDLTVTTTTSTTTTPTTTTTAPTTTPTETVPPDNMMLLVFGGSSLAAVVVLIVVFRIKKK